MGKTTKWTTQHCSFHNSHHICISEYMITLLYSNYTQYIASLFDSGFCSNISYLEEGRWVQEACLLLPESAVHLHSFGNHYLLLITFAQDSCKSSPLNVHIAYGIEIPYWWEVCERLVYISVSESAFLPILPHNSM